MTTSSTNDPEYSSPADPAPNDDTTAVPVFRTYDLPSHAWNRGTAAYPPAPPGAFYPSHGAPAYLPHQQYPATGWPPVPAYSAPKAWPVVVFTVIFGFFGAISAARRSRDARALGLPSSRYWWTFGGSLVASFAIWTVALGIATAVLVPLLGPGSVVNSDELNSFRTVTAEVA